MKKVFLVTNFSDACAHAANYACALFGAEEPKFILINIYTVPSIYAADGISLTTVKDDFDDEHSGLQLELHRLQAAFPKLDIEALPVTGPFRVALHDLVHAEHPDLIVMGAPTYSELWHPGADKFAVVRALACPVLIVPPNHVYRPFQKVGFAFDGRKACTAHQVSAIADFLMYTGAILEVLHIADPLHPLAPNAVTGLELLQPEIKTMENDDVIDGLGRYAQSGDIGVLAMVPRQHGIWHMLFNRSNTREVARTYDIPVLAVHED